MRSLCVHLRLFALAPLALFACAPAYGEAFLASFNAGKRAVHAGRYLEAAKAYDDAAIRQHSRNLGHVPIIDVNPRAAAGLRGPLISA